jgi:hypothetical protein
MKQQAQEKEERESEVKLRVCDMLECDMIHFNGLLGTRETCKREIKAREIREKETTSPAWNIRETKKIDKMFVGPTIFSISSNLRRKEEKGAFFHFYP